MVGFRIVDYQLLETVSQMAAIELPRADPVRSYCGDRETYQALKGAHERLEFDRANRVALQ